ncbi:uncharacterized protein G2W53_038408 [Senna tora]|uniref:Uncharacterized protein n=1 Tax=Senna tora TaxID=362788 RepID=A0A834SLZ4_9FABA|nr:uncharacterized protein G2W53_038408 [Senna tora]
MIDHAIETALWLIGAGESLCFVTFLFVKRGVSKRSHGDVGFHYLDNFGCENVGELRLARK